MFEAVARGRPQAVPDPKSAARELIGDRFGYSGASAKVRPLGSADVSLPQGLRTSVDVVEALRPEYEQVLSAEMLLRDLDEFREEMNMAPPGMYWMRCSGATSSSSCCS